MKQCKAFLLFLFEWQCLPFGRAALFRRRSYRRYGRVCCLRVHARDQFYRNADNPYRHDRQLRRRKNRSGFLRRQKCSRQFSRTRACCLLHGLFKTLPLRELHSGIGEIIKYAVIGGDSILNLLQGGIINNAALISACCEIKRKFVEEDEFDNGTRRILNLGHTFGHVFEAASGFSLSHGEAVGLGLAAAADFGEKLGFTERGIAQKIISLLREQGLKTNYAPYCTETAAELLLHDKKGDRSGIDMVFIKEFGHVFTHRVSTESAIAFLNSFCVF